jgi:transposase
MSVPLKLRDDFCAGDVRAFARRCKEGAQVRRLLAIAAILDGGSRSDAALVGGVTRQIVRDWVLRFNAEGPDGLVTRKAPGPQTILNDGHRRALAEIVETGPIPASHGVVRWRIIDLAQWLFDEFKISISKQALGHELRTMGYRKLSARPCHQAQRSEDIAIFKKSSPPVWRKSAKAFPRARP